MHYGELPFDFNLRLAVEQRMGGGAGGDGADGGRAGGGGGAAEVAGSSIVSELVRKERQAKEAKDRPTYLRD